MVAIISIFFLIGIFRGYRNLNLLGFSAAFTTALAKSSPPFPPYLQTSLNTASSAPAAKAFSLITSISSSVSISNLFIQTTAGTPCINIFSICFSRFSQPLATASGFGFSISSIGGFAPGRNVNAPPCIFNALTETTITTASGTSPLTLHLIFINFSAPQSAPNPLSVTT